MLDTPALLPVAPHCMRMRRHVRILTSLSQVSHSLGKIMKNALLAGFFCGHLNYTALFVGTIHTDTQCIIPHLFLPLVMLHIGVVSK